MRRIVAIGAAKHVVMPEYKVPMDVLDGADIIRLGDVLLVGKDEMDYHAWTMISPNSPLIGKTVSAAEKAYNLPLMIARHAE